MSASAAEVTVAVATADTPVLVAIARLEGKVDATLAVHGSDIKTLREVGDDHEERLRIQEARKTVSPRGLWVSVTGAVAAAASLFSILNHLTA